MKALLLIFIRLKTDTALPLAPVVVEVVGFVLFLAELGDFFWG